jgi:hypothetical protein
MKDVLDWTKSIDLSENLLKELVTRKNANCVREIYWLNKCLRAKNAGANSKKGEF